LKGTNSYIKQLIERITELRNKVIAHSVIDTLTNYTPQITSINIKELRQVFDSTIGLFESCSFGSQFFTSFYVPNPDDKHPKTDDIIKILDLIIKNSSWLNSPERNAPFWNDIKKHKSTEYLEELNKWRRKYGLGEA